MGPAAFGGASHPAQYLNSEVETRWAARRHRWITVAHSALAIQAAGSGSGVTGMREKTGFACRAMLAKDIADSTPGKSRGKSAKVGGVPSARRKRFVMSTVLSAILVRRLLLISSAIARFSPNV